MRNATRLHIFEADLPSGGVSQSNVPIPEEEMQDGGPSFEFIRKAAKMGDDCTLALLRVTLGGSRVPAIMFVDEDGPMKGLKPNYLASSTAGQPIVGNVAVWAGKYTA